MATPEREPLWSRVFGHFGPQIEFLLFGVLFLGLGSLVFIAWVVALFSDAVHGDWRYFAETLIGGAFIPLFPLIGVRWLRKRREERRASD